MMWLSQEVRNRSKMKMFGICKITPYITHLLNLVDKMCKYEINLASIVEDTEQKLFCPQIDGQTHGRESSIIPPPPFQHCGV